MEISAKTDYAVRAMLGLAARYPDLVKVDVLVADQSLPRKFLEAILGDLRRANLVRSQRGAEGGYALARPADMISIADLIRHVDGPLALTTCASRTAYARCDDCPTPDDCRLRLVLLAARDAMAEVLEKSTLAQP